MSSAYHELLKGIETRLKAGIPLRDAVEGLGRDGKGRLAALADALGSELGAGATLAEAKTRDHLIEDQKNAMFRS